MLSAMGLSRERRQFADADRLVTLGLGLDGLAVPALDSFRLRPQRSGSSAAVSVMDRQVPRPGSVAREGSALVGYL